MPPQAALLADRLAMKHNVAGREVKRADRRKERKPEGLSQTRPNTHTVDDARKANGTPEDQKRGTDRVPRRRPEWSLAWVPRTRPKAGAQLCG